MPCPSSRPTTCASSRATTSRRTRRASASRKASRSTIPAERARYSEEQYLRSPAEMAELFADLPEAVANTVEIAKRCSLEVDVGSVFLPDFVAEDRTPPREFLERRARERARAAARRARASRPTRRRAIASASRARSRSSARWASRATSSSSPTSSRGRAPTRIPVGPGRGSGVGSLVAYALGITNLDPLAHDLLFERFLNPERVSLPDFDIDFCIDGRDRVIDYVGQRYGRERVAQIATYGTMAARAVVRDVGRALGMPYGYVDRIAKLIPFEIGITLDKAHRRRRGAARASTRTTRRCAGSSISRSASRGSRATSARTPAAS